MMLKGDEGLEVFDDKKGHPYVMTAKTDAAVEFFSLADGTHTPHENYSQGLGSPLPTLRLMSLSLADRYNKAPAVVSVGARPVFKSCIYS